MMVYKVWLCVEEYDEDTEVGRDIDLPFASAATFCEQGRAVALARRLHALAPSLTRQPECRWCGQRLHEGGNGTWLDHTDGDGCSGNPLHDAPRDVHEPSDLCRTCSGGGVEEGYDQCFTCLEQRSGVVCGFCEQSFNPADSDARRFATFCCRECEREQEASVETTPAPPL